MYGMIREQSIVAMELKTPYSPVIHNPWAMGNLMELDGHFCTKELKGALESALIIELDIRREKKLGWN